MLKGALLACAAALSCVTGASAEVVFIGSIRIVAATTQCKAHRAGDIATSRYHPRVPGTNANFTGLSFVEQFSARGYGLDNGDLTTDFKVVYAGGVGWGDPYNWSGSQIRLISRSPTTVTTSTRFVTLHGQIKKPGNDLGGLACVITFEASYTRDPNS